MSRPEHSAPPQFFYNESEAKKYTCNKRIAEIQSQMTQRAIELLNLPSDQSCLILDLGCGSGLSGEVLEEEGHEWVGLDISEHMLQVAKERQVEGDLFLHDLGQGLGFRPGVFDGAISISVLQWLCNADAKHHNPYKRLSRFFSSLYMCLSRGARAVFQFYPENSMQTDMITMAALNAGFTGGVVVDYPNSTKAKKMYLCLFAGILDSHSTSTMLPKGLTGEEEIANPSNPRKQIGGVHCESKKLKGGNETRSKKKKMMVKSKEWILHKKEQMRKKGDKKVANDSKYTGRRRKMAF